MLGTFGRLTGKREEVLSRFGTIPGREQFRFGAESDQYDAARYFEIGSREVEPLVGIDIAHELPPDRQCGRSPLAFDVLIPVTTAGRYPFNRFVFYGIDLI